MSEADELRSAITHCLCGMRHPCPRHWLGDVQLDLFPDNQEPTR